MIQDTLLFRVWLKQGLFLRSNFEVTFGNTESKALERVTQFLQKNKNNIVHKGNNLKTPKFPQMLHVINYVSRHGCPMNYDGSSSENFGKLKIKDSVKLTNKKKDDDVPYALDIIY